MFCSFRHGSDCLRNGEGGTLSPFLPLSLRAIEGEGEEKTEGSACAMAQALPSSLVLGRREGITERSQAELRSWVWLFRRDGFPTPRE